MPAQRKLIPKKDLRRLYFTEKLSMNEIGMRFGCNHVTIVNRFKEFGWKSRGNIGLHRPIKVTEDGLRYMYGSRRLSLDKIARMLGCSEGGLMRKFKQFRIDTRGTSKRIPYKYRNKLDFDGNRILMAYMIGFREGDLNVGSTKQVVVVRCSTTIPAQVQLIRVLFKKFGGICVSRAKRGIKNNKDCWRLSLYKRNELLKFLGEYVRYVRHENKRRAVKLILQAYIPPIPISPPAP